MGILMVTGTAEASYKGTPGKVAYLLGEQENWPLRLWDPVTEQSTLVEPTTWQSDNSGTGTDVHEGKWTTGSGDTPSAPSWSPDGSKFAFAKLIDDPGDFKGLKHSAIFTYTLATGQASQITHPEQSVLDKVPEDPPMIGHVVSDFAPAWSPDGNTIAFIRRVTSLGENDDLYAKRGQNLWRTPAGGGGGATQVSTFVQESGQTVSGGVWIPDSQDLVVSYLTGQFLPALGRVGSAAGSNPSLLAGSTTQVVTDFDVSPDGTKLAFSLLGPGGVTPYIQPLSGTGAGVAVSAGSSFGAILRYAGTGDGLLHSACTERSPSVCGLLDRLTPDSHADIDSGELDRLALVWDEPVPGTGGSPGRMALDVQPQELPVIFVPGFLGTRISCGAKEYWPDLPNPALLPMSLGEDGASDAGCQPGAVFESTAFGFADVYGKVADYVRSEFGARGTLFGWDWRKRPNPSFTRLDTAIGEALESAGPWKGQQAGRVVLWGHSYGGLLIREFIKGPGGARVARVLTVGTPYWGSPKSFFPLAFGVESPVLSVMDALIDNDRLKSFARNLSGLYNLYPSTNYPAWLSVDGALQNQAGVAAFVASIGGNSGLFNQASADHRNLFDGFYDHDGRIDVRVVVGTGMNTLRSVNVQHGDDGRFVDVSGSFDNGDETVPGRSGAQGPVGVKPPLGDPIHVQYACNFSHVPLPSAPPVLDAYAEFLKTGEVPRKLPPPCPSAGGSYRFAPDTIGRTRAARRARAAGSLDLDTAEQQGLVDVMNLGPTVLAVVNDRRPVTLRVPITNGTFTYTPLAGVSTGPVKTYGPVTGTLELASGAAGAAPVVLLDGRPLTPTGSAGPPPSGPGPGPAPAGPGAPAAGPATTSGRMKLIGRPRLRGRTLKLVLELPGAGKLDLRATAKRRVLGTLRKSVRTRGRRTLKLKLKRKPPAKVRLDLTFTPVRGAKQTKHVTVKRTR